MSRSSIDSELLITETSKDTGRRLSIASLNAINNISFPPISTLTCTDASLCHSFWCCHTRQFLRLMYFWWELSVIFLLQVWQATLKVKLLRNLSISQWRGGWLRCSNVWRMIKVNFQVTFFSFFIFKVGDELAWNSRRVSPAAGPYWKLCLNSRCCFLVWTCAFDVRAAFFK